MVADHGSHALATDTPAPQPVPQPATYADILGLPEHMTGEIIDGELHAQPRPASPHIAFSYELGSELHGPFHRGKGGPGGWIILPEIELHLGTTILVPDISGWRRERVPEFPRTPYITIAPDWVCEIISPESARRDRVKKMRVYAQQQITWYWLVDPDARTLEVFHLVGDAYQFHDGYEESDKARAAPFDAIELDLALLWKL